MQSIERKSPMSSDAAALENSDARTYVVPVDEKEPAENAFKWADKTFPKSDRFVLHHGRQRVNDDVLEEFFAENGDPFEPIGMRTFHLLDRDEFVRAYKTEEPKDDWRPKFLNLCKDAKRNCEFVQTDFFRPYELSKAFIDTAHQRGADSILLGVKDRPKYWWGSITSSLLKSSDVPVTVVKTRLPKRKREPHEVTFPPLGMK